MRGFAIVALAAVAASLGGCSKCSPTTASNDDASVTASVDAAPPRRPKTTSADLALGNLNDSIEARLASKDERQRLGAVSLLLDRAHYLGKIGDLEAASNIVAEAKSDTPDVHYARASVHNALHRFDEALRELDAAGPPTPRTNATRASIFAARGQYEEALALQPPDIEHRDPVTLAVAAILAAKMQKPGWDAMFADARARYSDVSPFALAWMAFQRGMLHELAGDDARARLWFTEAIEVFPYYAHAAVHLASTSIEHVKKLESVGTDDPDVLAALGTVDRAKKRFDEVLAKYPEAFADHGARFYLHLGSDPARALSLAKLNAKNRPTEEALDLWMAAAAGANQRDELCQAVHAMNARTYLSERGRALVTASRAKCPD